MFDIGWSDISQCQACQMEEGTEEHRLHHSPERHAVRREIPEVFRKWEQKTKTSKKEWKWQIGKVAHPLSESQWKRGHFRMKMWESEKHRSKSMQVEGFTGQVATDGSLIGETGKLRACGWAVVHLDYDEEMGPLCGMYGTMEAECEVQHTIKRAELTTLLCFLKKVIGPIKVHVDNKGTSDGLQKRRGRVYQAKSGRCRFMDQNLGRIAWSVRKRHLGGSGTSEGASHQKGKETYVAV